MSIQKFALTAIAATLMSGVVFAQDDVRDNVLNQIIGNWEVEVCDAEGVCETGQRNYEYDAETGIVHYTEFFGGEQTDGYLGYNDEADSFYTFDDSTDANSDIAYQSYYADDGTMSFYDEDGNDRMLEWTIEDGGESMSMRAFGDTVIESPTYVMEAIFTRVPLINDDDE